MTGRVNTYPSWDAYRDALDGDRVHAAQLEAYGREVCEHGRSMTSTCDPCGVVTYPYRDSGRLVWACCESSIGPLCRHLDGVVCASCGRDVDGVPYCRACDPARPEDHAWKVWPE